MDRQRNKINKKVFEVKWEAEQAEKAGMTTLC
jgi:hypothetical protein